MKNIVFFCNKDIGLRCLRHTFEKKFLLKIKIVAVFTKVDDVNIINFCKKNRILVLFDLKKILMFKNLDIGISVQYHIIFKKKIISKFKYNLINLHMGPLPEYRGCNQFTYAIINEETEFGTTIHIINEHIDSGPILFQKRFKINKKIWVQELYILTCKYSFDLFKRSIKSLILQKFLIQSQKLNTNKKNYFYLRSDIKKVKKINLLWKKEKIEKYIRATSMPNFDSPHIEIDNKLIKLKL